MAWPRQLIRVPHSCPRPSTPGICLRLITWFKLGQAESFSGIDPDDTGLANQSLSLGFSNMSLGKRAFPHVSHTHFLLVKSKPGCAPYGGMSSGCENSKWMALSLTLSFTAPLYNFSSLPSDLCSFPWHSIDNQETWQILYSSSI
jgi:hypothetical protein